MERDKGLWGDFGGKWSDLPWVKQTGKTWDKLCYKLPKAKQSLPCVGGWYCIDADLQKTCREKKQEKKEGKILDFPPYRNDPLSPSLIENSIISEMIQEFSNSHRLFSYIVLNNFPTFEE